MKIERILVTKFHGVKNGFIRMSTEYATQITMSKNDYHEIHSTRLNTKMKEISL